MMAVLVDGGSGFIGTNLVATLDDPIIFDKREPPAGFGGQFIMGDIRDIGFCSPVLEVDRVVNLAAVTGHRQCSENPNLARQTNVIGTRNVLEFCRLNDAPMIFTSSCGIYGARTLYTETKLEGERLCREYAERYGLPNVILRLANVYGPHSESKNTVISNFMRRARRGEPLVVEGDGEQTRDFVHVEDVCKAIVKSLGHGKPATFNVGTGRETSINQLVDIFRGVFGDLEAERVPMPEWRKETEGCPHRERGLPVARTWEELGLGEPVELRQGLKMLATRQK